MWIVYLFIYRYQCQFTNEEKKEKNIKVTDLPLILQNGKLYNNNFCFTDKYF